MHMQFNEVVIVGAGISGLSLALLLRKSGFPVTVYELRPPDVTYEGALVLAPNGLKVLDTLGTGTVKRLCGKGYEFRYLHFRSQTHEYLDRYETGSKDRYGYNAFRIYRQVISDELKNLVAEAGITVHYNKKLTRITSDDEFSDGLTIGFEDGSRATATLIIGADGIHSRVRRHLLPTADPVWTNTVAVWCTTATAAMRFPFEEYKQNLPASVHGPTGAVHLSPQIADGSEMLAAIQWRTHERSRAGWEELNNDKTALRNKMEEIGFVNDLTSSAIETASLPSFGIWPFYTIPNLDSWSSESGNVIIVGDAAHAVPPTGGQGANQALEDAYTLSLLMVAVRDGKAQWNDSLKWWQAMRQGRISKVVEIATEIRARRDPGWKGVGAETIDSSALFDVDLPAMVSQWINNGGRNQTSVN